MIVLPDTGDDQGCFPREELQKLQRKASLNVTIYNSDVTGCSLVKTQILVLDVKNSKFRKWTKNCGFYVRVTAVIHPFIYF